jgi:hypothetical protein
MTGCRSRFRARVADPRSATGLVGPFGPPDGVRDGGPIRRPNPRPGAERTRASAFRSASFASVRPGRLAQPRRLAPAAPSPRAGRTRRAPRANPRRAPSEPKLLRRTNPIPAPNEPERPRRANPRRGAERTRASAVGAAVCGTGPGMPDLEPPTIDLSKSTLHHRNSGPARSPNPRRGARPAHHPRGPSRGWARGAGRPGAGMSDLRRTHDRRGSGGARPCAERPESRATPRMTDGRRVPATGTCRCRFDVGKV